MGNRFHEKKASECTGKMDREKNAPIAGSAADERERYMKMAAYCEEERESWREKLNEELADIQYNEDMKMEVIRRAGQKPSFWNREITISLPAGFLLFLLLLAVPVSAELHWFRGQDPADSIQFSNDDQAVEKDSVPPTTKISGSIFFTDDLTTGWGDE